MPTARRRQVPGERIALNQTRVRVQKYRRDARDARINYAQCRRDRESDLPIRSRLQLAPHC